MELMKDRAGKLDKQVLRFWPAQTPMGWELVMQLIRRGSRSVQTGDKRGESMRCEAQNPDTGGVVDGPGCPLVPL